jgi:hypothetical protein
MGVELVEGSDLFVKDDTVFMRTTQGPQRVDVIYRRSTTTSSIRWPSARIRCSACPACSPPTAPARHAGQRHRHRRRRRQVDLPLRAGDDPLLPRRGADPQQRADLHAAQARGPQAYVLAHLPELVVKEVHGAGGYGMLVGPASTKAEIEAFRARISPRRRSTSPSRRWRCPPARPSSRAVSRRATSTCAPSCSPARSIAWCRAA